MSLTLTIKDYDAQGQVANTKTYSEAEVSNPLTIKDVEGKSQNTTLSGDVYVDFVYNKKSIDFKLFNLSASDYEAIRGFYNRQFTNNRFPTITITELGITDLVVFMTMGNREINSQCIKTDSISLNFRETVQP